MPNAEAPHVLRVQLSGPVAAVRKFLAAHPTEIDSVVHDRGSVTLRAYLAEPLTAQIERNGLNYKVLFDATAQSRALRKRMGSGNRFDGGKVPAGLGTKTR
jgi:hypothetical protein